MDIVQGRDLVTFPQGDNSSDTIIGGIHWNLTTLQHWNYTHYSNGTFSNGSLCFLIFEPYTPHLLQNGTFLNSTSCYSPIEPLKTRSKVGLAFSCLFALSIVFTFINLRKHGRFFLPPERRFRAIGRRWQWYWMLAVAAFAIVSSITGVDVDRYYLPELPLVLSNLFWLLMLPTTMCVVWESVRHWGSWQERQLIDRNAFSLPPNSQRNKIKLLFPLVFYFFACINVFMIVPRAWSSIEKQRDSDQARLQAEPVATDGRFKAAAFCLFIAWLTTLFSLCHSIKHYNSRERGVSNSFFRIIKYTPTKFLLTLPLSLLMIAYEIACAFSFSISPLNYHTDLGFMYGLGWMPISLIIFIYETYGYIDPNEDRELVWQRRARGVEANSEMGVVEKPQWWSRLHEKQRALGVNEIKEGNVGGVVNGRATSKRPEESMENGNMLSSELGDEKKVMRNIETDHRAMNLLYHESATDDIQERYINTAASRKGREWNMTKTKGNEHGDSSNRNAMLGVQSQKVRSMLDV